ncbi:MAG TPA: hypothetical protein VHG30_04820 [Microvirga sp.]|nr:hypothetical protein [Microvirga sp.]
MRQIRPDAELRTSSTAPIASPTLRGAVFFHPREVLEHPRLSPADKRALLAAWASDACAVEGRPALRQLPDTGAVVTVDEILAALRALDRKSLH